MSRATRRINEQGDDSGFERGSSIRPRKGTVYKNTKTMKFRQGMSDLIRDLSMSAGVTDQVLIERCIVEYVERSGNPEQKAYLKSIMRDD